MAWPRLAVLIAVLAVVAPGCSFAAVHSAQALRPKVRTEAESTPTTAATPSPTGPVLVPPSLEGVQWSSLPTDQPEVALTFDCGANDAGVAAILAALQSSGAAASFTMTGRFAQLYPDVARQIAADGYEIGDHTYDHLDLTRMSLAKAEAEVTKGAQAIQSVTGVNPQPDFRFPYGAWNRQLFALVNSLGYGAFSWTVDTLGWEGTTETARNAGGQTVQSVESRALRSLTPGEIILMHCGSAADGTTLDADALPAVIQAIQAQGYHFVTLSGFLQQLGSSAPTGSSTKYTRN